MENTLRSCFLVLYIQNIIASFRQVISILGSGDMLVKKSQKNAAPSANEPIFNLICSIETLILNSFIFPCSVFDAFTLRVIFSGKTSGGLHAIQGGAPLF